MDSEANQLNTESNLIDVIKFRYMPYWPVFVLFVIIFLGAAQIAMTFMTPKYESTSDILIKDEKKGTDDSKMMESLNIFNTKKIVEDEIEVLQSLTLSKEVVKNLSLYAPFFEETTFKVLPAYTTSPVSIELSNYDSLFKSRTKIFVEKQPFSYDTAAKAVVIGRTKYPLDEWIEFASVRMRFVANPHFAHSAGSPLFFTIQNPKVVSTALSKTLNIAEASKLSTVVTMSIVDEVPQRGEDILSELLRSYNNAAVSDKNLLASNTLSFVKLRLGVVKKELDSIELNIQRYKAINGVVDLGQQSSTVLRNVGDNNQKVADVSMQMAVLDEVEKYVSENKVGIIPSTLGVNDQGLLSVLQKFYDAQNNYDRMKQTMGENNPTVAALASEIAQIKPSLLDNIKVQKLGLKASLANLNSTNNSYNSVLQGVPSKERGLLEITRQETILTTVYSFLLQKREEAALSYASTVPDSRTVNTAESTIDPVSPKRIIVFGIALALALFSALALITIKDFFNSKVLFRKDIEGLTLAPIIGEISNFARRSKTLILEDKDNFPAAEEFRHLRTAIGLHGQNLSKKKMLVTSGISGEGKTFISSNMALSLAAAGKKVVLLDFDLRKPEISTLFKVTGEAGVADFLEGEKEPYEIIKSTFSKNLFVCGAGQSSLSRTDLSFNKKLDELFDYLEGIFDFIIVDSSPVRLISDTYILSEYCDYTLYVVRHNYTPKVNLRLLEENRKIKPLKNMALVFNGIKSRGIFKKQFGIEYGYGYENFSKDEKLNKKTSGIIR